MTNANTVESILNKVKAESYVASVYIFTRDGEIASNGWRFCIRPVEAAIAAHGDEKVSKWKIENAQYGSVRVIISLQNEF